MTGGEIAATAKAVEVVAKKALKQDEITKSLLLNAAQGGPEMAAAARTMAARIAVKERIMLKLYQPFARLIGVSREYFEDVFPEEMAAKAASIPDEHMIAPAASLAVPAMQGLSFSFDEPDLKELYLNLLTTATDSRRADAAHPAFADVIKQLTSAEARLLNAVLAQANLAIARVNDQRSTGGFQIMYTHLMPLATNAGEPEECPQAPLWVDNWIRLGLVEVSYDSWLVGESAYDWVNARPEYVRLGEQPGVERIDFTRGVMRPSSFGKGFHRAVTPPDQD